MTYTIWLTDACNMNCKYCYEKNKVIRNMNSELADKTIEFISKTNIEKNLLILLHGGEALMNYNILIYFVKKLKNCNTERMEYCICYDNKWDIIR